AALVLLIGVDVLYSPAARTVRASLTAPQTVFIGEPAEAHIDLTLDRPIDTQVTVLVDLSQHFDAPPIFEGVCPPAGLVLAIPLTSRRRGTATIESVWVRYPGPLGLIARRVRIPLDEIVAVVPNVLPARRIALRCAQDRHFYAGLKIERYRG